MFRASQIILRLTNFAVVSSAGIKKDDCHLKVFLDPVTPSRKHAYVILTPLNPTFM